jgi:thiamine kinase-like enzyme
MKRILLVTILVLLYIVSSTAQTIGIKFKDKRLNKYFVAGTNVFKSNKKQSVSIKYIESSGDQPNVIFIKIIRFNSPDYFSITDQIWLTKHKKKYIEQKYDHVRKWYDEKSTNLKTVHSTKVNDEEFFNLIDIAIETISE